MPLSVALGWARSEGLPLGWYQILLQVWRSRAHQQGVPEQDLTRGKLGPLNCNN